MGTGTSAKKWYTQKTTWAAIAGVFTGVSIVVSGDITTGITTITTNLAIIFLRQSTN